MGREPTYVVGNRPVGTLEVEVRPPSPWRMPAGSSEDRTVRVGNGVATRFLHVADSPIVVWAWQPGKQRVALRAEAVGEASDEQLELAIERMRFALGVDDDLTEFFQRFRRDQLIGPLLRRMPDFRPKRHPWPWESLAWAVVKQLIESRRAATIQRRIVGRWGPRLSEGREALRDVPSAAMIAGRAPAELQSMDLSAGRSLALRRAAAEVAAGRCDLTDSNDDRRLRAIPEIGPWTIQCLALFGRGDHDSLPAGDLAYIKLVGRLAGLGRRATIDEVEDFYAPYEPYRGLVGTLTLAGLHREIAHGSPLRYAA